MKTAQKSLSRSVSQRARNSDDPFNKVIFDAIQDAELDWRTVDHDRVKELLVRAVRARRASRHQLA